MIDPDDIPIFLITATVIVILLGYVLTLFKDCYLYVKKRGWSSLVIVSLVVVPTAAYYCVVGALHFYSMYTAY